MKRTSVDFSKHTHRVEIFTCGEKEIRVDHFQVGDSRMNYLQFVNTDETLTVTGDFGNWIFCRPFVPTAKSGVSDFYWLEKLRINSEQKFDQLDLTAIAEEIQEKINGGLEEYGYEGEELQQAIEWYQELLENTDDFLDYTYKAYRDSGKPDFIDYDEIPMIKLMPEQLKVVFDAFDEMCLRLKNAEKEVA